MPTKRLSIDGRIFRDAKGREVTIRGINVAGDAKFPVDPDLPSHKFKGFFDGDTVSFVGRPFSVEAASTHFARLKRWGYNTIRYIFTWEAIEHEGPGKYDEEWIQHTISILRIAKDYGFYIFMDPHQDVWSRFSGGSGAPLWTLYACGLDPEKFAITEAAWVHNSYPNPAEYPKMVWATNYYRLACGVTFTLFFGGREFAPKAIIDGKNIQDYLQDHFVNACQHLAKRVHEAGDLEDDVIIGWESLNEPNRGLISLQNLEVIPEEQKMQKATSPTAWQAILTGSGRACEIDTWDVGGMGPYKSGSTLVDPKGEVAWLSPDYDDSRYGWKRDPGWKLGECLWAQHGVWDPRNDKLLKKDYFAKDPKTGQKMDYEYFSNTYFMHFYKKYKNAIRAVHEDCIMFFQPPVLEIPPSLKGTEDEDPNMVYAPHYYDGVTLLTKSWNRLWNVDVFGVLRGRYLSPAFAVKIGETAIRNCLRDQLSAIRQEGVDYLGEHPCVLTEIGIPYDMDDKKAYTTGDYTSQSLAMDANHFAIEGSGMNGFTLWVYMATNNHNWGDLWNGEDLSIFSEDDRSLPLAVGGSATSLSASSTSYSKMNASQSSSLSPHSPTTGSKAPSISGNSLQSTSTLNQRVGFRAAEAYVRPAPVVSKGNVRGYGFDLRNCSFTLSIEAPSPTVEHGPTEIYLPDFHFPKESVDVEVDGGRWEITVSEEGGALVQKLHWWHNEGEQTIKVRGPIKKHNVVYGEEEDNGYMARCMQNGCNLM